MGMTAHGPQQTCSSRLLAGKGFAGAASMEPARAEPAGAESAGECCAEKAAGVCTPAAVPYSIDHIRVGDTVQRHQIGNTGTVLGGDTTQRVTGLDSVRRNGR